MKKILTAFVVVTILQESVFAVSAQESKQRLRQAR